MRPPEAYRLVLILALVGIVALSLPLLQPAAQTTYDLLVSTAANRSNPVPLEGAAVSGNIYIFVSPETGISQVKFFLDDSQMTGTPRQVENLKPWDFAGTASDGTALPFNSSSLAPGTHTVTASIKLSTGSTVVRSASFLVEASPPDQVHLAWVTDPSTTLNIIWRTRDTSTPSIVEYREVGQTTWQTATGALRPSGASGTLHEANLSSLAPSTAYEYRVSGDGGLWSPVFTTRTAPPPGPADFEAVFVADTGIVGRTDGLATGTQQVINEIAAMQPLLVLLGGDYAYFDTDKRFVTLNNTIDAWFDQMQAVATRAPMMVAYGNHEILLGEGYEHWSPRFATPPGFDDRRNYSFDVGDVHFISVFAVQGSQGLPSTTLAWLEQDIIVARNAGQRWIIPFYHVSPFADGTNHPSNLALRAQLGPIFEQHGVKVAISAHDQAYERSSPLTDVPATNTPTSFAKSCFEMEEGVTWVKVSPGGKLSSISGSFSPFASQPQPAWTAVRNNSVHTFARLLVSAQGSLRVEVYGVTGDGSPPVILDSFEYTTGTCAAELTFDTNAVGFTADQGTSAAPKTANLSATDLSAADYTLTADAAWLTATPTPGSTPAAITLSVDTSGLAAGTYQGKVQAAAPGYVGASLPVVLKITEPAAAYQLQVSTAADRSNPSLLEGQTASGNIYVFTSPTAGVKRVRFFLDDPAMTKSPRQVENTAPYDFAGTATNGTAKPFNTTTVSDGSHVITAAIEMTAGGTTVLSSTFMVQNNSQPSLQFSPDPLFFAVGAGTATSSKTVNLVTSNASVADFTLSEDATWLTVSPASGSTPSSIDITVDPTGLAPGSYSTTVQASAAGYLDDTLTINLTVYDLLVSTTSNRASPVPLEGSSLAGNAYVFTAPTTGVTRVSFYFDNPTLSGTPSQVENGAPHDFKGTAADGTANPFITTQVADSLHTISAKVELSSGGSVVLNSHFTVANGSGGSNCAPLPCGEILVELPYTLDFAQDHAKILDGNNIGTGFTYVDRPPNGVGYIPGKLAMDLGGGAFHVTTTAGIAVGTVNSQDNALGVGVDAPSQITLVRTTLINPPAGTGNFEQAGLWFGNDQDNYLKLTVLSTPQGTQIEFLKEVNAVIAQSVRSAPLNLAGATVELRLSADPIQKTVKASYTINGGSLVNLATFQVPSVFFSFDAAGIDPTIGTRTFTGVFATHRNGPAALVYTFGDFSVEVDPNTQPPVNPAGFTKTSFSVPFPTNMVWGPDDRLYVTELFGTIHAFSFGETKQPENDQVITALTDALGPRLTLGITVDPESTPSNVILWVSHSSPSLDAGVPNSSTITRLSGPSFSTVEHIITGLPRALANHAVNSIHFGPDGKLYLAAGGNTGGGAPNDANTEFGTMEEQPLSAALLVADVKNPNFDGSCANEQDIFGPPPCDVVPYATGLRNAYDFVFHSNGSIYAPDNGLSVQGTFPPLPTPPCTGLADSRPWTEGGDSPGEQPDILVRIQQGKYYGHPNPYRNECVFKDGSYQGVSPLPNYVPPILVLGNNRSADGTVEYTYKTFFSALKGELLIANFSVGDDITRVRLTPDGLSVFGSASLAGGFNDPLALSLGPDGTIYVSELGADRVTAMDPHFGRWFSGAPMAHARHELGVASIGTKIYAIGGNVDSASDRKVEEYDTVTKTWRTMADLPEGLDHIGVTAVNNKVYVFGGLESFPAPVNADVYEFDPAAGPDGTWSLISTMPQPAGGMAVGVHNGLIYLAGGFTTHHDTSLTSSNFWRFDPVTRVWTQLPDIPTYRDHVRGEFINGKFYVVGGRQDGQLFGRMGTLEVYDPATNQWSTLASMPTPRRGIASTVLEGRLVVLGGEKNPDTPTLVFEEVEAYDPVANTWGNLAPMKTPRHASGAVTINGRIYSVGGATVEGGCCPSNLLEIFTFANRP